jgi:hypothetical protein
MNDQFCDIDMNAITSAFGCTSHEFEMITSIEDFKGRDLWAE